MGKVLLLNASTGTYEISPSETFFNTIGQAHNDDWITATAEVDHQYTCQTAGVFSGLSARISANSLSTAALTIRIRVNSVNGNGVLSIAAGVTGWVTDGSNTDTIAAGDEVGASQVAGAGGTGTATIRFINQNFAATSGHSIFLTSDGDALAFATDSVTRYLGFSYGAAGESATEAHLQIVARAAGTLEDLSVRIRANARTTTTTYRSRKNTANGNMVISVTSGATGTFQDTSNTDTIASGDVYNGSFTTSTGGSNITWNVFGVTFTSSAANVDIFMQGNTGAIGVGETPFFPLASYGMFPFRTTESDAQVDHNFAGVASKLRVYTDVNASATAVALKFRKNAANGNQSVSITALTTGAFEDASNTDSFTATDDCCLQISNITVGAITLKWIAVTESTDAVVENVNISVFDTVTVSESVTMEMSLDINVFDGVTVTEAVTMEMSLDINVFDGVTVTEAVTIQIDNPTIEDTVTVTESVTVVIEPLMASTSDDVTLTESVTMDLGLDINVFDGVTISEFIDMEWVSGLATSEDVTVSESVTMMVDMGINVFDGVTITEGGGLNGTIIVFAATEGVVHMRSTEQSYPLMMDENEVN